MNEQNPGLSSQSAGGNGSPPTPPLQEWQVTLEELHVAEEELRLQNEALAAAHDAATGERQKYHELFNFAPDAYLLSDAEGTVREANEAALHLLGVRAKAVLGKPLVLWVAPESRPAYYELLNRLHDGKALRGFQIRVLPRGGTPIPVELHVGIAHNAEGRMTGLRWMMHNLTQLRAAQYRALQDERLAAIGQTVAALAHESRNALQRSQACLRMLALEVADRPAALDLVARIEKAHDGLQRLFDDIRAYAAPLVLKPAACNLTQVWREAWDQLEALRRSRPCTLEERVEGIALECTADGFRLEQVFRNIFDNAILAGEGPLHVVVTATKADLDGRPALDVAVRDNGPGMSPAQQDRLFEPFFTTKAHGTGLGMAIARRIVDAHGGRIFLASSGPEGTEIRIRLPREVAE